jgi:uncharacterized membrane protein YfcA
MRHSCVREGQVMEILFGCLIAMIIGMTGAGGGTLAVPVLVLAWGLPTAEAVGTSMVFATVVKLVAAPVYVARQQFSAAAVVRLLAGGLPGVLAGTLLLNGLHKRQLDNAVAATVGATTAILAIANLLRSRRRQNPVSRLGHLRWLPWVALPIGVEVGFSSAGAGALGCIALMSLTRLTPTAIVGTDLLFGLGLSAAGSGLHLALGSVNGQVAARLLVGGVAGALIGPWLSTRVPARVMRTALSVALSVLGAQLFWRGVAPLVH